VNRVPGALFEGFVSLGKAKNFILAKTYLQGTDILVYHSKGCSSPLDQYIEVMDEFDDSSVNNRDTESHIRQVLVDIVLCYVVHAMDNSSTKHLSNCYVQFYTTEELSLAKDITLVDNMNILKSSDRFAVWIQILTLNHAVYFCSE